MKFKIILTILILTITSGMVAQDHQKRVDPTREQVLPSSPSQTSEEYTRTDFLFEKAVHDSIQKWFERGRFNQLQSSLQPNYLRRIILEDSIRTILRNYMIKKENIGLKTSQSYTSAISGRVLESDGVTPVSGTPVRIYYTDWSYAGWIDTDQNGYYLVGNLKAENYYVYAEGYVYDKGCVYFDEYYLDASSKGAATQIAVADSDTTVNINFTLNRKGAIAGRVCESDGTTPIANTMLMVYNSGWEGIQDACTDANGYYTVYGLLSGDYYVMSSGYIIGEGEFYLEEYYDHSFTKGGAISISVSPPNTVNGINFAMTTGMHIRVYSEPAWAGIVSISPEKLVYAPNETVELYASVSEVYTNYRFDHWGGDHDGTDNPTIVLLDTDKEVTAYFADISLPSYYLNVAAVPTEAGVIIRDPETAQYDSASIVYLFAEPENGWTFKEWTSDVTGTENPTTILMNSDKYVTGIFGHSLQTLSYPTEGGSVCRNQDKEVYDHNEVVEITAEAADGFCFKFWEGGGIANPDSASTTVTMDENRTVIACFEEVGPEEVTLTMQVSPEGVGETCPEVGIHTYPKDEVVQIIAYTPEGYQFAGWEGAVADWEDDTTTVTMNSNKTVIAFFEEVGSEEVTLTMRKEPAEGGTIQPPPGIYIHEKGDIVDISAAAADGYHFKKWKCSVEDPYDPTTVVYMNQNETVTAIFESDSVTLHMKVYPENCGDTEPSPGTYTYERGDTVDIEAIPAEGYKFWKWKCSVKDPDDPTTVVYMNHNETVTAEFKLITYQLTIRVNSVEGGTTVPAPGKYTYEPGTVVEVTAVPAEGYEFVNWTGGVAKPNNQTTCITMNSNKSIKANFEKIEYTLTLKTDPVKGGRTEPESGKHTYTAGEIVELVAVSNEGYQFIKWTGEVSMADSAHTTVLINKDKTVTACFDFIDNISPKLKNCFPCPNSKAVPQNITIKFKVYDKNSGLNSNTLNAWINDLQIIVDGQTQTGEDIKLLCNAHTCKVTYNSSESFENGSTVSVFVKCSDNAIPAHEMDSTYSFKIGTATINKSVKDSVNQYGGSIVDTSSQIQIHVPPYAVDNAIEITIDHIENAPELPEDVSGIATPYHFGPDGLEFNVPVVIQIPYTEAMLDSTNITDPMNLELYYFHSLTGEWTQMVIDSVDIEQKSLYITVKEFCYFNLVKEKEQTAIDNPMMDESKNPDNFSLLENYPNPFNPETHILISIPQNSHVILSVYNMKGSLIRILIDEHKQKGEYDTIWDGRDQNNHQVSTGIYLFRMKIGNQILIRKGTLLK